MRRYEGTIETRFKGLGYLKPARSGEPWRFVDMTDSTNHAVVGPHYRTKTELLADLERFAREYGF